MGALGAFAEAAQGKQGSYHAGVLGVGESGLVQALGGLVVLGLDVFAALRLIMAYILQNFS